MHIKNNPLVTIALSVLNGGSQLELSVRSLLVQTWPHWELLIFDDGSNDGVIDRLDCLSDPRINIIRDGSNIGLAARLNQAIVMANGKYFARMDHDDICHPERFSKQVFFLERHPEVDLLATQCITMDEQERLQGVLPSAITHEDICRRPWQGFYMAHPTWMGRIKWFRQNTYLHPAPYYCEDQELLLRAYRSSCYHTLPELLLAYRVRTRPSWKKLLRTHVAMLKIQSQYFFNHGEWIHTFLSSLVAFARIGRDGIKELYFRFTLRSQDFQSTLISFEEYQAWETHIEKIKTIVKQSAFHGVNHEKKE